MEYGRCSEWNGMEDLKNGIDRVYTVRENQGKTYLFRDGQGKSGKVREFNEKVRENLEKVREFFLESSYLL